jgi:hypothetical protein
MHIPLSRELVDEIMRRQGDCAICGAEGGTLVFDYDEGGRLRGLLCERCYNLIELADGWQVLSKAFNYLLTHMLTESLEREQES